MSRRWMKLAPVIVGSLLALALPACDLGSPTDLGSPLGPSVEAAHNQGQGSNNAYRRVRGGDGDGSVSGTIGLNGGRLTLGHHELVVPRGAVDAPTFFQMTLDEVDHIQVHLTAMRTLPNGSELNVGAQGFLTPVTLKLSYRDLLEMIDPTQLMIAWVRPDGSLAPRPSSVDVVGKRVHGSLDHFSRYAIAID